MSLKKQKCMVSVLQCYETPVLSLVVHTPLSWKKSQKMGV